MEQEMIGILVNASLYKGIPRGRTGHEILSFYEEGGKQAGLTPVFLCLEYNRGIGSDGVWNGYVRCGDRYVKTRVPLPKVIHNRAMYFRRGYQQRMAALAAQGTTVYNACNRYGKMVIHELLLTDDQLRPHLPVSMTATVAHLRTMMAANDTLIIKPVSASVGRGVMKLARSSKDWVLTYPSIRQRNGTRTVRFRRALPQVLRTRIRQEAYLVQQCIPLALYQGRPFDLRVSVQRDGTGIWQVTGIVGKVAAKRRFVTNVARGGSVETLDTLLSGYPMLRPEQVSAAVHALGLRVAEKLSAHLPHLADIGLDIGITADGFPMFIECNGRDQRYSFGEGRMTETWKRTYINPMAYGRFLLNQMKHSGCLSLNGTGKSTDNYFAPHIE
ncbi:YheC/YheD family endospore coat-associated protein [Paenibacillus swuensis]|uniref:YheC/YheD family endospore coat-associated protein n=1 Tax=Paenibacillus swuensis TaxID=1178515 RepID=UPI000838C21D|nr:YheC/YheD family protein [Paenibacillus swuensis]